MGRLSCCLLVSPSTVMLPTGEPFNCALAPSHNLLHWCTLQENLDLLMLPVGPIVCSLSSTLFLPSDVLMIDVSAS